MSCFMGHKQVDGTLMFGLPNAEFVTTALLGDGWDQACVYDADDNVLILNLVSNDGRAQQLSLQGGLRRVAWAGTAWRPRPSMRTSSRYNAAAG